MYAYAEPKATSLLDLEEDGRVLVACVAVTCVMVERKTSLSRYVPLEIDVPVILAVVVRLEREDVRGVFAIAQVQPGFPNNSRARAPMSTHQCLRLLESSDAHYPQCRVRLDVLAMHCVAGQLDMEPLIQPDAVHPLV